MKLILESRRLGIRRTFNWDKVARIRFGPAEGLLDEEEMDQNGTLPDEPLVDIVFTNGDREMFRQVNWEIVNPEAENEEVG